MLGPGDDAAVVATPDGRVVATTDLLVAGRHFRCDPGWSSAYDVGRKAAAQNFADIAAMGAMPTALLVGLATPARVTVEWCERLADGLRDECDLVNAAVVGGDIVEADMLTVAVTALGDLRGRDPVTRSGAESGQSIVVLGRLGWAAAGLALLEAGRPDLLHRHAPLVSAHRHPEVEYDGARALAAAGATAMIDVSDGLAADLGHIAAASGVGLEVSVPDLPVSRELVAAAADLGVDPLEWVQSGGEDHAFVATLPAGGPLRVMAMLLDAAAPYSLAEIGRVVPGTGLHWLGGPAPRDSGYTHFGSGAS